MTAFFGAVLSGFLGMAGGVLLFGVMLLTGMEPVVAIPVHAAVQIMSNGTRVFALRQHVHWHRARIFVVASLPFPALGLWIAGGLSAEAIKVSIGAMILLMFLGPRRSLAELPERWAFGIAGVLSGTLGVVVGAFGPLLSLFFLRPDWGRHAIISTQAVVQTWGHLQKLIAFAIVGLYDARYRGALFADLWLVVPMALVTILGTYVGRYLLGRLSEKQFRVIYLGVLVLLAVRLLLAPLLD
ncbi:MAG: sulfite exporter TauE/SafE family protein [Planctomycetota bacterium]